VTGARCIYAAVLAAACSLGGCATTTTPVDRPQAAPAGTAAGGASHLRVEVQPLATVSNSGLELPVVSPDGRYVACLDVRVGSHSAVTPASLMRGEGLAAVSLKLLDTTTGRSRTVATGGACWPSWTAAGKLLYVSYDGSGSAMLVLYDPATGDAERKSTGLAKVIMAAPSPDGRMVAMVALPQPGKAIIRLLTWRTATLLPGPAADGADWQLRPIWLSGQELAYVQRRGDKSSLMRWQFAAGRPCRVATISTPADLVDAGQSFAGIVSPRSPDGRFLAYYDAGADAICLVDLTTGRSRKLEEHSRAGCWAGPRAFAECTGRGVMLMRPDGGARNTLMDGTWLACWGAADGGQILCLSRGSGPWTFNLVRMRLIRG